MKRPLQRRPARWHSRVLPGESLEPRMTLSSVPVAAFASGEAGEGEGETAIVQQINRLVFVIGREGLNNDIRLDLGLNSHQLTVDGESFSYDAGLVDQFLISGGQGTDAVRVTGTSLNDRVRVENGRSQVISSAYKVFVRDSESVIWDGGTGTDRARIYDNAGNDELQLRGPLAKMVLASGNSTEVRGIEKIEAFSRSGNDTAKFFDSAADDEFVSKSDFSYIIGTTFWNYATGFKRVEAFSENGGNDVAKFADTTGNDRLEALPDQVTMTDSFAVRIAHQFSSTETVASTGNDIAEFRGRAGVADKFRSDSTSTTMRIDNDYLNSVAGFDRIEAIGADATDTAELIGSTGNDTFAGLAGVAELRRGGVAVQASSFGSVLAVGQGGDDKAYLQGAATGTNDIRLEANFTSIVGTGFSQRVEGFDVNVYGSDGDDQAVFQFVANEGLLINTLSVMGVGPQRNQVVFNPDFFESFAQNTGLDEVAASELAGRLNGSYPIYRRGPDYNDLLLRFEEVNDLPTIDPASGDVVFAQLA